MVLCGFFLKFHELEKADMHWMFTPMYLCERQPSTGYPAYSLTNAECFAQNLWDIRNLFTFGYSEVQRLYAMADTASFNWHCNFLFFLPFQSQIFSETSSMLLQPWRCLEDDREIP